MGHHTNCPAPWEDTMTRPIRIASLAAAAAAVSLLLSGGAQAEWRGWNIHVPDYPVSLGMEHFTAVIAEKSDGRLTGKTYHSACPATHRTPSSSCPPAPTTLPSSNSAPWARSFPRTTSAPFPSSSINPSHFTPLSDGRAGPTPP